MPALVFIVFILALLAVFRFAFAKPTLTWRQTITLTIETPNGPVAGQSTQCKTLTFDQRKWTALRKPANLRGEALVTDLGDERYLILVTERPSEFLLAAANRLNSRGASRKSAQEQFRSYVANTDVLNLTPEIMPALLTFGDPKDPETVRIVKPDEIAAVFGQGYRLGGVTIQVTEAPLTRGRIAAVLPWLLEPEKTISRSGAHIYASKTYLLRE